MSILNNFSVKAKLFGIVFFLVLVSLSISGIVFVATQQTIAAGERAVEIEHRLALARKSITSLLAYARAVEFLPLELGEAKRRDFETSAEQEQKALSALLTTLAAGSEVGKPDLREAMLSLGKYDTDFHFPVRDLSRGRKFDDATKIAFAGADLIKLIETNLSRVETLQGKLYQEAVAEMQQKEHALQRMILLVAIAGSFFGFLAAFAVIVFGITRPLTKAIGAIQALAAGNTDLAVEGAERKDEIGDMLRTIAHFRENVLERARLEGQASEERQRDLEQRARIDTLILGFRGSIGEIRATLDREFATLRDASSELSDIASQAAEGANTAQDASQDSASNVHTVAKAAGELTSASREISEQVHMASACVTKANEVARAADQDVSSLANLADRIGAIVDIISSIAEQTNMLALNATIEAARAGEAGRSFAVVASEVKTLAGQTAKATDEISTQVRAIQQATQTAVLSIRTIAGNVGEIEGRTTAIAAAVEEQEASTHEISKSISLASDGSHRVTTSVVSVSSAVEQTSKEAQRMLATTDGLMLVAGTLTRTVDDFLKNVSQDARAA
jgi:methyl-accepting chemotaxis protein